MAFVLTAPRIGHDGKIIGVVASAHFFSHLYLLTLPPIFPLLNADLGVSYAALGLAIAIPNLATGLLQSPIGFLVDRFGAALILAAGQMVMASAIALIGIFPNYQALLALMLLAGIGNAVFHPANYAILAECVAGKRTGRAFSIHTFGGYAGSAAAPILVIAITGWTDWPTALIVMGGLGVLHAFWILGQQRLLQTRHLQASGDPAKTGSFGVLALLRSRPILMAFLFFVMISTTLSGFLGFSVVVLDQTQGMSLADASLALSVFLWLSAFGVLFGGMIADRTNRHDFVAITCFVLTAAVAIAIASASLTGFMLGLLFAVAGLATGTVSPSRDMLVRAITPPGASGKVFGFVTTGFNVGGLLAPPMFGALIDWGRADLVFWCIAALSLLTSISVVGAAGDRRRPAASPGTG